MSVQTTNSGKPEDEVVQAPEGHDAAMAAKFDGQGAPTETTTETTETKPERPAHIPEKFWKDGAVDVEGLAKSYAELEKGKGKAAEGEKASTPAEVTPEQAGAATTEDAKGALESVGLNYDEINSRFQQSGELAAEDRAALNKAGVPDGMIDAYIAGQTAQAEAFQNSVFESVGGKDEYAKMTAWAAQGGLSKGEISSFNATMGGKDGDAAKMAIAGLKSRFEGAMGQEPQLHRGSNTPEQGSVFRSTNELTKAMADPRYKNDPAYRDDVISKLNRSSIL